MTEICYEQVLTLTNQQLLKEKVRENSESSHPNEQSHSKMQKFISNAVSEVKPLDVTAVVKQEDLSSVNSDVVDIDSPCYTVGVHSSTLPMEPANSSHVFEADLSHDDEEENFSKNVLPTIYNLPKLEDLNPSANSCNYGFITEDQPTWFWSY